MIEGLSASKQEEVKRELLATLQDEEKDAIGYYDTTLSEQQENALDFYEARPFGNEEEGRSQIVMPDVQEVVDYATISTLQTVLSTGNIVEFEAKAAGEEEQALEATEAVNYVFMKQQDGQGILTSWFQSGAIEKIGVIKTTCFETTKRVRKPVVLDAEQAVALDSEGLINEYEQLPDGTISAVIEQEETVKEFRDYAIPSEEFLFSAHTSHEDEAGYLAHRTKKTISELIELGVDREIAEGLTTDQNMDYEDERSYSRWRDEEWTMTERNDNMREVTLFEEYIKFDINDDGIAERIKVYRVGNEILDVEEVDEQPFVVFTPFPRAHRMVGDSVAEKVMDIQLIRSILVRNSFDSVYATNRPRILLNEDAIGETTIEDLLQPDAGAIVRYKGANAPRPLVDGYDINKSMGFLEFFTGERESRTGITRLNQGLEKDAFNATATGTIALQEKGEQMERYVASNFISKIAQLFEKKRRLMIKHGALTTIRVGGEVKQTDSTNWGDMDVTARVGLGSHRKDFELNLRRELLEFQKEAVQYGSPLVNEKNIYNNMSKIIRGGKLGLPTEYINDPDQLEPQPEKPDPAQEAAQAELQMKQQEMQMQQRMQEQKLQMQQQEAEMKINLAAQQAEADAQLARDKAAQEANLAEQKFNFEKQMSGLKMEHEIAMADKRSNFDEEQKISKNRSGGDLSK